MEKLEALRNRPRGFCEMEKEVRLSHSYKAFRAGKPHFFLELIIHHFDLKNK